MSSPDRDLQVSLVWSAFVPAPWDRVEAMMEAAWGPLGPEWGTTCGDEVDLMNPLPGVAAELANSPSWREWTQRHDLAEVDATLVVDDRADRASSVQRTGERVRLIYRVPAAEFDDGATDAEVCRVLLRDLWSAAAQAMGWTPPPPLPSHPGPVATGGQRVERAVPAPEPMSDAEFWEFIAELGGRCTETSVARLRDRLASTSPDTILEFAERLAVALHRLDTRAHANQQVRDRKESADALGLPMSADAFLHTRCAVVAAGRSTHERILACPDELAGVWDVEEAEDLLFVPAQAWKKATGQEWEHQTRADVETGSNEAGWN